MSEFKALTKVINEFVEERDWDQFHSPKNLAMALAVEAAELMEVFQWLSEDESRQPDPERLTQIADEIADVQWYLLRIADRLNLNIPDIALSKMEKNRQKYPVERSRGSAAKYTNYE